jgi:acylphosphatase
MNQAHIFISGSVQGVGYRYFVRSTAQKLGLTGWVRNTEDGGVEAVFQGKKEKIEEMIGLCRKGPFLAEVKQLGVDWEEAEEELKDFTIQKDS